MNKKASAKELATLALAKSIVEGDAEAAMGALKAKADYDAFWIDGATRLRDLAKSRGARSVSLVIEEAARSRGLKALPPMAESPDRWSRALVEFVALRGYEFSGMTTLLSGDPGTKLRGLDTAKAAAKLIGSKWNRIKNAKCEDARRGGASHWTLSFGPIWQGERRVTGFEIQFSVDARVLQLVEKFHEAQGAGAAADPPSLCDPLVSKQKDWEASFVAERHVGCGHGVDGAISCLREGGNPFDKTYGSKRGEFTWDDEGAEMKSFMALVRREVGPGPGWHVRLAPFLTDAGLDSLKTKFDLESSLAEMGASAARRSGPL
ncbi:hypothetical protein NM04_14830 [Massilia aurea]|uniref:Uncharacterized protein n=1 Tax=Massilia aurea TaxID=373040 RepID=A0A422QJ60_9BURK|nr:hypothetical protein [Massilia aurea]RNF30017.1 hypothetical protein NM04_14830 [Massilia aurea]